MIRFRKRLNPFDQSGLTLIEVLIVVFILSVILAIVIPNYAESTRRAQAKLCYSAQIMAEAQIELYRLDTKTVFPPTDNPMEHIFKPLKAAGYLRELPECPSGGEYRWIDNKIICKEHGHHDEDTVINLEDAE